MRRYTHSLFTLLFLFTSVSFAAKDEIVFSTAPTHSREETVKLYRPLMQYLTKVTGKPFVIKPAANFVDYAVRMRMGKYDMLFDGPHLTGWRMVNLDHTPVGRFPGTIRIVVVTKKDSLLNSMDELEYGSNRVCAFASPNMLTMAFLSHFDNPVRQPYLVRTQGFNKLIQCLKSGRGDAAVLRDKLWNKMSDEEKADLKLIAAPQRGYPERTFSVSSKLDASLRKQIAEALLSEEGQKVSQALLARFKKKNLISADAADYDGLDKLLNPVWGFHARY